MSERRTCFVGQHYEGDARDLALDFTVTEELFGKHTIVELRPGGADLAVTNDNKLQYVHAVADYKLNKQVSMQCRFSFVLLEPENYVGRKQLTLPTVACR